MFVCVKHEFRKVVTENCSNVGSDIVFGSQVHTTECYIPEDSNLSVCNLSVYKT